MREMSKIIQPIGDRIIIPKRKLWMGLEDRMPPRILHPRLSKMCILTPGSSPSASPSGGGPPTSLFECSWATGTGAQNTTPTAPEDAFSAATGTPTKVTDDGLDDTNCVLCDALSENVINDSNYNAGIGYMRAGFKITGYGTAGYNSIFAFRDSTPATLMWLRITTNGSSALTVIAGVKYDGSLWEYIGSEQTVTLNTWYQAEIYIDETSNTAGWRLFDAAGAQLYPASNFQVATNSVTNSTTIDQILVGCFGSSQIIPLKVDAVYFAASVIGPVT